MFIVDLLLNIGHKHPLLLNLYILIIYIHCTIFVLKKILFNFRNDAGYVIQAGRLLPSLTVKETLTYASKLMFPTTVDAVAIQQRVSIIR